MTQNKTKPKNISKPNNGYNCPLFILDVSFMKEIFQNINPRNPLFLEILKRKQINMPMKVVTTSAAFARAIYLSDNMCKISNIKLILSLVDLHSSTVDFKDELAVTRELNTFMNTISRGDL